MRAYLRFIAVTKVAWLNVNHTNKQHKSTRRTSTHA